MLRIQRATFYPRPATDGGGTTRGAEKILGGTGNDSLIIDHEKKISTVRPSVHLNEGEVGARRGHEASDASGGDGETAGGAEAGAVGGGGEGARGAKQG